MASISEMLDIDQPFVRSVFLLTDFSKASKAAFSHALGLAVRRKASLSILNVSEDNVSLEEGASEEASVVRRTLERWGSLSAGGSSTDVAEKLGVNLEVTHCHKNNAVKTTAEFLVDHPADLMVLPAEGRKGMWQWMHPSVAEKVARMSQVLTLFVSEDARGIISPDSGDIQLKKILIPIDFKPHPRSAIILALRAAKIFNSGQTELTLLHVGADEKKKVDLPELPDDPSFKISRLFKKGKAVDEILSQAKADETHMIVMATEGHRGITDEIAGSVTEQVVRGAPCPVLAIPVR